MGIDGSIVDIVSTSNRFSFKSVTLHIRLSSVGVTKILLAEKKI